MVSGKMVNYSKSVSFSSNTTENDRQEVCRILDVKEVNTQGKYLGLPMSLRRNKVTEFGFLVDRIAQKLQMWRNHSISKAGKVTLLKTAAQTIPNFWMSLLLIPGEVCDRIEKKMNFFWWGNGSASTRIKWMSWDRLCTVKEDGGLGFKKLKEFNIEMLAKQAWRLLNNDNPLVTKLIQALVLIF